MGSIMSLSCSKSRMSSQDEGNASESRKRQKMSPEYEGDSSRLIPGLPDELSMQILARLPRICYFKARLVSGKWKSALLSSELYSLRQELGKTEEWLYVLTKGQEDKLLWYALDPVSMKWQKLPPMPATVYEEEPRESFSSLWNMANPSVKVVEIVRNWFRRKDASEQMPFCGCSIGAVGGCLYVLGGFSRSWTMNSVWRFDPVFNKWSKANSMLVNRAYSKTGILNNKLYVVGGVNNGRRGGLSPIQSAEVYDPSSDTWLEIPSMPFSKAEMLPNAFFTGFLKPIATGMTSYNGRLCVSQSLYSWPIVVDVGGEIYDPETNSWVEMPAGMGEGWPARQAGTKLSVVVDGELYAFDPSSSAENGKIKVYDQNEDAWKVVIGEVPVYDLTESESPYLLAGLHGKLHFITRDRNRNITVLRADVPDSSSSPSSSSSPVVGSCPFHGKADSVDTSDTVIWNVIATKDLGAAELISCQVIDL
ncbi:PREDICTED: F-box/kelch-repeat protein At1g22040 [Tarenaya hassleriana]|uniref:F-box/kelch-repeat protein At1g22040 n=1 Tax=Tarenaya hassleriana TaxID=28532 RepID=UPI00053C20EC|nr:PREDICTED: F-box/kelch-repeat protein At1g22040 [Tarenaya hassleriana]